MAELAFFPRRTVQAVSEFLRLEAAGGVLLVVAAALAFLCANSLLSGVYQALFELPVHVRVGALAIEKPLLLWINDGLMAVFFLLVGLELKRELLEGQFAERSQLLLPIACAVGGMVVPMAIYALINAGNEQAMRGVAIPAATDIAFALGVLSLLGSRVPLALKMLLTAIAVADDLGAIIIIAIFYTTELSTLSLLVASAAIAVLVLLNRLGVRKLAPYLLVGVVLWISVLKSGVHATLAGVALGLCIPLRGGDADSERPLDTLEHALHPWVAYGILPVFAFANAGVSLAGLAPSVLLEPVPLGIALGLLLGKPLGVFGVGALLTAFKLVHLPEGVNFRMLFGMSLLCGIGFTMSLFIGSLAFESGQQHYMVANRLGILAGSLASAALGYLLLRRARSDSDTAP